MLSQNPVRWSLSPSISWRVPDDQEQVMGGKSVLCRHKPLIGCLFEMFRSIDKFICIMLNGAYCTYVCKYRNININNNNDRDINNKM